ncbi:hypothetical protein EJ071_21920 [Mesorhizobium sp. M1B.F.Ca.ET.045.04.1.1]|nr:hypothetical protein EJ071_21920 [Mesorhizobium sp. M1B.F.Ca.ET.045.04.1.1]
MKRAKPSNRRLNPSTIRQWVLVDVEGFAAQYAQARDIGLDAMADEMFEIADDGSNDLMNGVIGHGLYFHCCENRLTHILVVNIFL